MKFITVGTVTVEIPFNEKQLKKLTIENLTKVAINYKKSGLKVALIKHLTAYNKKVL